MPLHSPRIFVEARFPEGHRHRQGRHHAQRIGAAARENLERFFGIKVYLELTVQVRRNWRRDDRH